MFGGHSSMRMMLLVVLPVLTGAHLIVLLWIVGPKAVVSYFRPPLQCSHGLEFDCKTKHSINIRTTRRMLRGVAWLSVCGVGLMITNLSPHKPLTESCSSLLRTTSACIPRSPSLPYQYAWSLMSIATMGAASKMVQHLRKQSTAASSNRVYSHLLNFLWSHDSRRQAVACWQRAVWPETIPRLERQIGDVPIPWRRRWSSAALLGAALSMCATGACTSFAQYRYCSLQHYRTFFMVCWHSSLWCMPHSCAVVHSAVHQPTSAE